ncbi:alanine/ornithine racemase family PLP-dependent enzyme [Nocardioides jejuensis]|uniref:Alanine/ornithine racemase family PLP-dependent enzyme n=1 Tax=Nocardioides jejuensis TaxID=2502782 RepID=A0A4R1C0F2_9ACTN|nr:alanine/ornithine racemase family PLP-dependent enzyme [Nocardioides jejuensis]TCJ23923.1 alanine/ornithine racemase family PLP-dependent enzyme [Nocardioides jejuensis]
MSAPRLVVDLVKVEANTRQLVEQLRPRGISVTGVTKAALGSPEIGAAMLRGGAIGLADSRIENLTRLAAGAPASASRTLIRSPMISQVDQVVRHATTSLNTGLRVLDALDEAARRQRRTHQVVLMVELGDLREGIAPEDVIDLALTTRTRRRLRLAGLGTNLACQNGVVPDDRNMGELSRLVEEVEAATGESLAVVSGGNSANLPWALSTSAVGRINDLRIGEAILLGTEPLHRTVLPGLHDDAFRLVAEVIEAGVKPSQPWGALAQTAYGELAPLRAGGGSGTTRQAILALGRQDVLLEGLVPPPGITILGMSSDHLVVDCGDHRLAVGDELTFGVGYGALVQAMTSPFVAVVLTEPAAARGRAATPGTYLPS